MKVTLFAFPFAFAPIWLPLQISLGSHVVTSPSSILLDFHFSGHDSSSQPKSNSNYKCNFKCEPMASSPILILQCSPCIYLCGMALKLNKKPCRIGPACCTLRRHRKRSWTFISLKMLLVYHAPRVTRICDTDVSSTR